jgi:hypothetical protein
VSTSEELLERKSSGSGLENRDYGRRRSAALTTRYSSIRKKLALSSPTSGGRTVGIVRSQTEATEFFFTGKYSRNVGKQLMFYPSNNISQ